MKKVIFILFLFLNSITFKAEKKHSIPFELIGDHTFITVSINGHENLNFIFDTGAGGSVLNSRSLENLSLSVDKESKSTGAGSKSTVGKLSGMNLIAGDLELESITLYTTDLSHLEKGIGKRIDGIIGFSILSDYVVTINYDLHMIEMYDQKRFKYNGNGKALQMKMKLFILPLTSATIITARNLNVKGKYIIDTGAGGSLIFTSPYSKKYSLKEHFTKYYTNESVGLTDVRTTDYTGRLKEAEINGFVFQDIPCRVVETNEGVLSWKSIAGLIGNQVLCRFNITFDYRNRISYWEPNKNYHLPFPVNCSGLTIESDLSFNHFYITKVYPGTQAEKAGFLPGDELVAIYGISISNLQELQAELTGNDKEIAVSIIRNNEEMMIKLVLSPLI